MVAFTSDHGYQLGEHNQWTKKTNFEVANHVPMMFRTASTTPRRSSQLVELVDLFPTLADLSGLKVPPKCPQSSSQTAACSDGESRAPIVRGQQNDDPKSFAFWQMSAKRRGGKDSRMGYSIRSATHRYTAWLDWNSDKSVADWAAAAQDEELYDLQNDPQEDNNVAGRSEDNPNNVAS